MGDIIDKIFTIPCDREYYSEWRDSISYLIMVPLLLSMHTSFSFLKYKKAKSAGNLYINKAPFLMSFFIIIFIPQLVTSLTDLYCSSRIDGFYEDLYMLIAILAGAVIFPIYFDYQELNILGLNNHNSKEAIKEALTQLGIKYRWDDTDPSIKREQRIDIIDGISDLKVTFQKYVTISAIPRIDSDLLRKIEKQLNNTKYDNLLDVGKIIYKKSIFAILAYFTIMFIFSSIIYGRLPFSYLSDDSGAAKTGVQYFGN